VQHLIGRRKKKASHHAFAKHLKNDLAKSPGAQPHINSRTASHSTNALIIVESLLVCAFQSGIGDTVDTR
jgi:hypothetical protein